MVFLLGGGWRDETGISLDGWMHSVEEGGGGWMLENVLIERLILQQIKPDRSITNTHTQTHSVQQVERASINPALSVQDPENQRQQSHTVGTDEFHFDFTVDFLHTIQSFCSRDFLYSHRAAGIIIFTMDSFFTIYHSWYQHIPTCKRRTSFPQVYL